MTDDIDIEDIDVIRKKLVESKTNMLLLQSEVSKLEEALAKQEEIILNNKLNDMIYCLFFLRGLNQSLDDGSVYTFLEKPDSYWYINMKCVAVEISDRLKKKYDLNIEETSDIIDIIYETVYDV